MIWLYSGKVGTGKSFHLIKDIVDKLKSGYWVVANFPINFKSRIGRSLPKDHFIYLDDSCWANPRQVLKEAIRIRLKGGKTPILLAIDEAGDMFNTREWQERSTEHDRKAWNTFFQQHRKPKYNIILVSQSREYLDKQIRVLVDYEFKHRLINKYAFLKLLPVQLFLVLKYWCETNKPPLMGRGLMIWKRSINKLYDTFRLFGRVGYLMEGLEKEVIREEQEKMDPVNRYKYMLGYQTWEGYE